MTTCLYGINLQVQVLVFDKTIDTLGEDALQITLTRATPCVSGHHAGDWGIGSQQGTEFGSRLELGGQN